MGFVYKNIITVDEVNDIRKSMGWRQDNPEQLQVALERSELVVAAYDKSKAIGMARLIWDGGRGASISNILIMPNSVTMVSNCEQMILAKYIN